MVCRSKVPNFYGWADSIISSNKPKSLSVNNITEEGGNSRGDGIITKNASGQKH